MDNPGDFSFISAAWCGDPAFEAHGPLDLPVPPRTEIPKHPPEFENHLWFARRTLPLTALPATATLCITADDHVRFYAGDRLVGEGPCPSSPMRQPVMTFDLRPFLVIGENVLCAEIYYQGLVNRVWNSGDFRQGFIAEIHMDGNVRAPTPGGWRVFRTDHVRGTPTGYQTQFTENWNSARYPRGWRSPGFDDSTWAPAVPVENRGHRFIPSPVPELVHPLHPVLADGGVVSAGQGMSVGPLDHGGLQIDGGREMAGRLRLRARGPAGATVAILYGEELSGEGRPRVPMRCGIDSRDTLTCSGLPGDLYEAVEYKAFRHIALLPDDGVVLEHVEIEERHDPEPGPASLTTDSPFRKIWDICHRAVTVASQGVLVDCPSREKGQYLGDLTVSGHARLYAAGDSRLWRKALFDFAESTRLCPGIMAVAPGSFFQEIADFSLQYPWQLLTWYRHTGDGKTLAELLPVARGILDHFERFAREDGLLADVKPKWNLVDWPTNLRDGYDFRLEPGDPGPGAHAALNGHYLAAVKHLSLLEEMAGVEPSRPPAFTRGLEVSFQNAFWRGDRMVDHPTSVHASLHANALALWAGAVPPSGIPSVIRLIREKGLACGVQMSYFVLKALAMNGERPEVWRLLTQNSEHSWMQMLADGATATLEAWGLDQKWNTSMCHPWAASPIPLFVEEIAGLRPFLPGWREVDWRPWTDPGIPDYHLSLCLPTGTLETWKRADVWGIKPLSKALGIHATGVEPIHGAPRHAPGAILLEPGRSLEVRGTI